MNLEEVMREQCPLPAVGLVPERPSEDSVDVLMDKIREELCEAEDAKKAWARSDGMACGKARMCFAEELQDVITACVTLLDILSRMDEPREDLISTIIRYVNLKNYGRGYLEPRHGRSSISKEDLKVLEACGFE